MTHMILRFNVSVFVHRLYSDGVKVVKGNGNFRDSQI